ncbi:MAG: YraN family protein [Bacteroidota bacterium]
MPKQHDRRLRGIRGETIALRHLLAHGYRLLRKNYRYGSGEIDLVCEEGPDLVFVEVKYRRSEEYGNPEEAVTPRKQERLRRTAEGYMLEHNCDDRSYRFDVVAILDRGSSLRIEHFREAF